MRGLSHPPTHRPSGAPPPPPPTRSPLRRRCRVSPRPGAGEGGAEEGCATTTVAGSERAASPRAKEAAAPGRAAAGERVRRRNREGRRRRRRHRRTRRRLLPPPRRLPRRLRPPLLLGFDSRRAPLCRRPLIRRELGLQNSLQLFRILRALRLARSLRPAWRRPRPPPPLSLPPRPCSHDRRCAPAQDARRPKTRIVHPVHRAAPAASPPAAIAARRALSSF